MINNITQNLNNNFKFRDSGHRESGFVADRSVPVQTCDKFSKSVNNERLREPANVNFCGLLSPKASTKLYTSSKTHAVLKFIEEQQLIFGAAFALILTCVLRPASIMALPGDKKNKDDKIYASAHSIASGVIGFALSNVLFYPLNEGVNRLKKNPDKFFKKSKSNILKNADTRKLAMAYLERMPDIVFAIPKGILTVALIPPILKYGFGYEKKKSGAKSNNPSITGNYQLLNFKSLNDGATGTNRVAGGSK